MSRLKVEQLKIDYPSFSLDLSFETGENEFISIIGPSGSGKSTVLSAIAGLIPVKQGTIMLQDRDITKAKVQERKVGMVFQDYALFTNMNAERNITYSMKVRHLKRKDRKAGLKNLLELVSLSGYEKRKVDTLSGGEQQRIALARALAAEPEVLLLDEPLSALDASLRRHLRDEIRRVHDERPGLTTIYVTHDREEAFSISDRIIIMRSGRIEMQGTPEEIYRTPATLFCAFFTGEGTSIPATFFNIDSDADTIFFRPEAVTVKEGTFYGDLDTMLVLEGARIVSAEFTGARYILGLVYQGQRILAESINKPSHEEVTLYIRKSQILFYKDGRLVV